MPCFPPVGNGYQRGQEQLLNAAKSGFPIATGGGSFVSLGLTRSWVEMMRKRRLTERGGPSSRGAGSRLFVRSGKGFKFLNLDDHVNEHLFFSFAARECLCLIGKKAKREDDNAG
jgi:hypothetical protein